EIPQGGTKQRAGGPPPPKQQKLDFGAKPVSGGGLKKLDGQYVVEERLPLNMIPTTVNAGLPHRTAFSSYIEKEYAGMERNLKAVLNEAFKVYQPVTESDEEEGESTPTDDDDVTFLDVSEILSAEDESDGQLSLPPHHQPHFYKGCGEIFNFQCREQGCV
ncbi:unnamed protein product, partial [Pleuronectes platessa]